MALASSPSEPRSLGGMALGAAAFMFMTSVDTIFKLVADGHPAYQILLVNGNLALVTILCWALFTGGFSRIQTTRPLQHLARGSTSVMSSFAAIYAYSRLPLTDFYAIVFAGPLLVTAMSAFWLGEKVDRARWIAIGAGFAGILIAANPFTGGAHGPEVAAGRIAAMVSVFCYALSSIMVRRMRLGESSLAFPFYGYCAALGIGSALFLLHGGGPALNSGDIMHLALSGVLGALAAICLLTAYHRAPVAQVAPFQYTQIIWGAFAGYLIWGHVPEAHLVAGACIVTGCGLFVVYQEMRAAGS